MGKPCNKCGEPIAFKKLGEENGKTKWAVNNLDGSDHKTTCKNTGATTTAPRAATVDLSPINAKLDAIMVKVSEIANKMIGQQSLDENSEKVA